MNLLNRCRTCLQNVANDPVKITVGIYEFLENILQLNQLPRDHKFIQLPQNICFGCYEEISKFKRFHQLCKDSEEFLKSKLESDHEEIILNCKVEYDDKGNTTNEMFTIRRDEEEDEDQDQHIVIASDKEFIHLNSEGQNSNDDIDEEALVREILEQSNHRDGSGSGEHLESENDGGGGESHEKSSEETNVTNEQISEIVVNDNEEMALCETGAELEIEETLGNETIIEDNITYYHVNEDDSNFIEYEMDNEERDGIIIENEIDNENEHEHENGNDNENDNENDEQVTIQTCEILDYESYGEDGEQHIEITFGNFGEQSNRGNSRQRKRSNGNSTTKREYPCRICEKVFTNRSTLRSHEYIHSDARPFICDVCGKAFRQANVLVTHMALHTGKKIECEICGKKFARKSQMILHNRMHKDEKPFHCDFPGCNASFRQNQYLIAHKETHTGVRRYQCTLCGRRFFNRPSLLGHMHRVHGNIYYQCDMCVREFKKSAHLRNHMKIEHQVEIADVTHLKKRKSTANTATRDDS